MGCSINTDYKHTCLCAKNQNVEEVIKSPRYVIGAIGHGRSMLHQHPSEPLPLLKLIFLYKDRDICAWLLASPGKDALDLLVLEKREGTDKGRARPGVRFRSPSIFPP